MILEYCSEWNAPLKRQLEKLDEMRDALLQKSRLLNELMATAEIQPLHTFLNDDSYQLISKLKQAHALFETLITESHKTETLKKWLQGLKNPYLQSQFQQCINNIAHLFQPRDPNKEAALFCLRQIQNNYDTTLKILIDHIEHQLASHTQTAFPALLN